MEPLSGHKDFIAEVAIILRKYCQCIISATEISRLVKLAVSIAQSKLPGRLWATARVQGTSTDQIATSVVAGLFTKRGSDSPLAKALESVLESDEVTLFLRFRNIVVKSISQELFHRWRENDPLSARLWRNLHRVILKDEHLVVFPVNKPEWVSLKNVSLLQTDLPLINHDEMVRIISSQGEHNHSLVSLITAILSDVVNISRYQNAVPIEMLFSALRETISEVLTQRLVNKIPGNHNDPLLLVAVDRATKQVLQKMENRLIRYQSTGKLHPTIVKVFKLALSELVNDYADGGQTQSYYEYLHVHKPELTAEEYRQNLRAKFEYLAESVRKDFIEAMREQYL